MKRKVIELEIIDELEESGVSAISLVDAPAINIEWMAFRKEKFLKPQGGESESEFLNRCIPAMIDEGRDQDQAVAMCYSMYENMERIELADYPWDECIADQKDRGMSQESAENICGWIRANMSYDISQLPPYTEQVPKKRKFQDSFSDYPEAAVNAAKRALKYRDENPEVDCGTPIGWARANQLANRENLSEETIARMASFARHLQYEDVPYSEGCGGLMVDAWGGRAGIEWAQRKLDEIREEFAEVADLKIGDEVSWTTGGQNPRGRIREIVKEGARKIPGADFEISGTPENPGYIIEIYEESEGRWKPTGKLVGRKADSILKNVQLNGQFSKNPGSNRQNETARRTKSDVDVPGRTQHTSHFSTYQNVAKTRYFLQEDQRIIVGPAMIPGLEIVRQDEDTKEIYYVKFSAETISKIAEKFMRELRNKNTNILHQEDLPADSYVMETWLVETENDKAMTKYGFEVPIGTWMVKMRVTNPKVWQLVKAGKLKGLSIEGSFIDKEEIDDYERSKILKKIIEILSEE